jgi:intracellular multiplication protein IcmV
MKIRRAVKNTVKPFVDVKTWVGYDQLKQSVSSVLGMFKGVWSTKSDPENKETFEEATQRLGLTEEALAERKKAFVFLMLFYCLIALGLFVYAYYLLTEGSYHGALASFSIMFIAWVQAFRYHFWLFQLKQRKLGCTFKEWFHSTFRGKN